MFKFNLIISNPILLPIAGLNCCSPELTPYLIKCKTVMATCFNWRFPIGLWVQPKWTHVSVRCYHCTVKTFANICCYILIFPQKSSVLSPQPTLNTLHTRRYYMQTAFRIIFEFKIICHPHFLSKRAFIYIKTQRLPHTHTQLYYCFLFCMDMKFGW